MRPRRKKIEGSSSLPLEPTNADAQAALESFLKPRGSKRPTKGEAGRKFKPIELAMREARRRSESGDWSDAKGSSFVGLYALCHEIVYGVIPAELETATVYRRAAHHAARFLRQHFDEDPDALVDFMKWSWEREKSREAWALRTSRERNRMAWGLQFSAALFTDYRVEMSRNAKKKRRGAE